MKDNANLIEKVKDIEHQNIILEGETDTIGRQVTLKPRFRGWNATFFFKEFDC